MKIQIRNAISCKRDSKLDKKKSKGTSNLLFPMFFQTFSFKDFYFVVNNKCPNDVVLLQDGSDFQI